MGRGNELLAECVHVDLGEQEVDTTTHQVEEYNTRRERVINYCEKGSIAATETGKRGGN